MDTSLGSDYGIKHLQQQTTNINTYKNIDAIENHNTNDPLTIYIITYILHITNTNTVMNSTNSIMT